MGYNDKLRANDDLRRSRTCRAAAVHALVDLPTWDRVAAASRLCQAAGPDQSLAMAKAGRMVAYKRLPVYGECEKLAAAALEGPGSGKTSGSPQQTELRGPAAAVLRCNTVSRERAAISVRKLKGARRRYFHDFRKVAIEAAIQQAPEAFNAPNKGTRFELTTGISKRGLLSNP